MMALLSPWLMWLPHRGRYLRADPHRFRSPGGRSAPSRGLPVPQTSPV